MSSDAVQAQLEKILTSKVFARSDRLSRFLRFVVEQALLGLHDQLKEYVLGLKVFDRRSSYETQMDPIVRVEARRLRTKLHDYYRTDGIEDSVSIELPERGYVPVFRLRTLAAPAVPLQEESLSIAVLPFVNMSPNPEHEYFSDGLTEELISTLAKIDRLRVVARTSVFQLKGTAADIRSVGAQLHAGILLEGSVRRDGDRVRISALLINVADGYRLWSDTYEREMKSVFAVQEEIAYAIANALKTRLHIGSKEFAGRRHSEDAEAYNLYLRGRYYLNLRTEAGFLRSFDCFRSAIARDPGYALAYAGLADAYSLSTRYDVLSPKDAWPNARAAALRSVELDDGLAESHTALAFVRMHDEWDWAGAELEFRRALEINPSYVLAHQWNTWPLAVSGRFEEAIASMKRAQALDPLSPNVSADLALAFYFARQFESAIEQCQELLDIQPGFYRPHQLLGMVYLYNGLYPEAIAELELAAVLSKHNRKVVALLACAQAGSGRLSEAQAVLRELECGERRYVSAVDMAIICSALGDVDRMFTWLDKAFHEHDSELIWLGIDPIHDRIRGDARFRDLVDRIHRSQG